MLFVILIICLAFNFIGGVATPAYRTGPYYGPSFGGLILLFIILYFLGFR